MAHTQNHNFVSILIYSFVYLIGCGCQNNLKGFQMKNSNSIRQIVQQINSVDLSDQYEFVPNKSIKFSGFDWYIKSAATQLGPGYNWFSDSKQNVFVDKNGYLNLKITKAEDKWYCSEVVMKKSLGYGSYAFVIKNGFQYIDKNVVLGLFTYLDVHHEIDFELSKWGDSNASNAQYVVQPYYIQGNLKRFNLNQSKSVVAFSWSQNRILFQAFYAQSIKYVINQIGVSKSYKSIYQWIYQGSLNPKPSTQKVRINLWLFNNPLSNSLDQTVVIKQFKYLPLKPQYNSYILSQRYGGNQGTEQIAYDKKWSLLAVAGKCGGYIDSISFKFVNIETGIFYWTQLYGGKGGDPYSWELPPGQWVTNTYIKSGGYIDSIQFQTNNGDISPKFGGQGGVLGQMNCKGRRIAGVKVSYGDFVNSITFILEKA